LYRSKTGFALDRIGPVLVHFMAHGQTPHFDHICPLLYDLHWLRIPECSKFRLCSLTFRCLHGTAPSYVADSLRGTASAVGRRHLWSSVTSLVVPSTRQATLGNRTFPVAAARTLKLHLSVTCRPYWPSAENWKHSFFAVVSMETKLTIQHLWAVTAAVILFTVLLFSLTVILWLL